MKLLLYSIALVLLCAVFPALAEKPPQALLREINRYPVAHNGTCKRASDTLDCMIFRNKKDNLVYVVLFDDDLEITHIIKAYSDMTEELLFCRSDQCT